MLDDIRTMIWKEFKEFFQGGSKTSNWLRVIFPIALVGGFLPWRIGRMYLTSPVSVLGFVWILPMVGITLTVDAFAGERERHTLETLLASRLSDRAILFGKLAASVLYSWGILVVSLVLALVTVNLAHGQGTLLLFSVTNMVTWLVFGFLLSVLISSLAILVSLRASTVRQASQVLAFGSMVVMFAALFGLQELSSSRRIALVRMLTGDHVIRTELIAALILTTLNVAVIVAAHARFQRAQLILD